MGPPLGQFEARVPQYADTLKFKDRAGAGTERGISVGKEWKYHSYIEGGTLASAIWTFSDVTPERYPEGGLPLEMTIRVFRSWKGDIEKGISGTLMVKNPRTGRASALIPFVAKDFYVDKIFIPEKLTDSTGQPLDLFADLASDGQIEIIVQCVDDSQYFGVAKGDLYLRSATPRSRPTFLKASWASGCKC